MLRTIANVVKLYLTPNQKAVYGEMSDRVVAAGVRRQGRWVVGDLPSCWGWRVSIGLGERDQFPVSDGVDGLVEVA